VAQWRAVPSRRFIVTQSNPGPPNGWCDFITSGARRSNGSRKARTPSNGPVCLVTTLWTIKCGATVRAGLQSGQFPAAGGAAPSGASLDVDDVAGEIDQDWGEGGAAFPENRLPDGGSGGAASVVSDDLERIGRLRSPAAATG